MKTGECFLGICHNTVAEFQNVLHSPTMLFPFTPTAKFGVRDRNQVVNHENRPDAAFSQAMSVFLIRKAHMAGIEQNCAFHLALCPNTAYGGYDQLWQQQPIDKAMGWLIREKLKNPRGYATRIHVGDPG